MLGPTPGFGWGDLGHRAVGKIAEGRLNAKTREKLDSIMKGESLARASTYSDEIRSDPKLEKIDGQKVSAWHYVEIPDGKTYAEAKKNPDGDALQAIAKMKEWLSDPKSSPEKRKDAVRWLVHLIGDLHQPLHVGNGRDRGANLCFLKWKGRFTNLHALIDDAFLESLHLSYTELADFALQAEGSDLAKYEAGDPVAWAAESRKARDELYPATEPARSYCKAEGSKKFAPAYDFKKNAHYEYVYEHRALIEKRIVQAGVRVAKTLNDLLSK